MSVSPRITAPRQATPSKRPECAAYWAARGIPVRGEPDDRGGAAVEAARHHDDARAVLRDPAHLVAPLAGHLDAALDGLGAGVHRQHHVLAAQLGERGANGAELVVVERAAGERDPVELACAAATSAGWRWPKLSAEYAARQSR